MHILMETMLMSARELKPVLSLLLLIPAPNLFAGDWPMWRYDAARSAASPDGIATNLTLLWSRKLPPLRQAWPLEVHQRLNFDASYEPVVMGQRLFLGSPNDGSVTAYDTETGAEQWKFYTEGPVRCAPACWKGRVYAGSDDGYLYCLEAATGNVVWKFRGAPPDRPDRRHLGNEHLVSFWPVRGGPVIVDGVVYFGAGIWSVFGVFLHALDAETGKAKWTNGELSYLAHVRADHEQFVDHAGLSPQGYLVAMRRPAGGSLRALDAGRTGAGHGQADLLSARRPQRRLPHRGARRLCVRGEIRGREPARLPGGRQHVGRPRRDQARGLPEHDEQPAVRHVRSSLFPLQDVRRLRCGSRVRRLHPLWRLRRLVGL